MGMEPTRPTRYVDQDIKEGSGIGFNSSPILVLIPKVKLAVRNHWTFIDSALSLRGLVNISILCASQFSICKYP